MVRLQGGGFVSRSDVVLIKTGEQIMSAGLVYFHFSVDGAVQSLVELWPPVEIDRKEGVAVWASDSGHRAFMDPRDMLAAVIHIES